MKNSQKGASNILLIILPVIIAFLAYIVWNGNFIQTNIRQQVKSPTQTPVQVIKKKIGDAFVLWNIEYKVISASIFKPVYEMQKTEGKYIGVKIKANNLGKTESGLNKIYVIDSKGRRYESTILGYQQLSVADYGQEQILAGIAKTYGIIFEVAKDSTGLKLEYPSSQGSVVASVDLGL
jgi:hypothetical protein